MTLQNIALFMAGFMSGIGTLFLIQVIINNFVKSFSPCPYSPKGAIEP